MKYLQTGAKAVQRGFTLIELMIVVAIIAVLATVALPAYTNYTIRAQITEGLLAAADTKLAIAEAYATSGSAAIDDIFVNNPDQGITTKFVESVALIDNAGTIEVTFSGPTGVLGGGQANGSIDGATIRLVPGARVNGAYIALNADPALGESLSSVDWACVSVGVQSATNSGFGAIIPGAGTVLERYSPTTCK